MKCKSCGTKITFTQTGIAGIIASPNCTCGKIRLRERLRGCSTCDSPGISIQIKKHWYGYLLFCTCGHKWRVWQ